MARLSLLFAATACGRLGFDADAVGDDGAIRDVGPIVWGPFSPPQRLTGPIQSTSGDWYPTPLFDQTELYIHRGSDVLRATRASTADDFSAAAIVTELSAAGWAQDPTLTADGLEIVFKRTFAGPADLFGATRASATAAFDPAVSLDTINFAGAYNQAPCLTADGLHLVFTSNEGGNTSKLYEASRADRGLPFSSRRALDELHVAGFSETTPTLSADGLELIFASNRPGGIGAYDAYTAKRTALDQPFSAPVLIGELSSTFDDAGFRLTPDDSTLYFNYDTLLAGGREADVWIATRTRQ